MSNDISFIYYPKKYLEEITDLTRRMKWSKDIVIVYRKRGVVKIVNKHTLKRAKIASTIVHVIAYLQSLEGVNPPDMAPKPVEMKPPPEPVKRKPFTYRKPSPNNEPYRFGGGYAP